MSVPVLIQFYNATAHLGKLAWEIHSTPGILNGNSGGPKLFAGRRQC